MSMHRNIHQRRTFLKGVGAALALPWLESLTALGASGRPATAPPVRTAFIFFPNGAIMPSWTPDGAGEDYELSKTLQPLAKFKSDFNVVSGLAQDNGRAKGDGPGDHARSAASFLTGAHPVKTSGANIRVGMSADQVAAEQIGDQTRLPSLEIGIERGRQAGNCDSGYSCAYSSTISWKTPSTPMAKEIDPRQVFERLFATGKDAQKGWEQRNHFRQSILDLVAEDASRLKTRLGQTDRHKVDEYFTSVRELEQRIERGDKAPQQPPAGLNVPIDAPKELSERIRLMYDLLAVAFQTDTTRMATFMLANEGSNASYPMVEVTDGHHALSHHRDDEEKVAKIQRIDQYLVSEFAYFLAKLKSIQEGDGTLLDHSMILYGSGISDGNRHRHDELPIVLAGRAGGTIKTGRHIKIGSETPLNNLFLSMIDRTSAKVDEFGDSTGRLTQIDA